LKPFIRSYLLVLIQYLKKNPFIPTYIGAVRTRICKPLKYTVMKKNKNILVYALLTYLSLGIYFLVIEALGLADHTYLRLFNGVIILVFMNHLIKSNIKNNVNGYLENFRAAFVSSSIAVVLGGISLIIFLNFKDAAYVRSIADGLLLAGAGEASQVGGGILIEGLASTMIFSFVSMQYWKGVKLPESLA
jgi:hypothetical protein